MILFKPEFVPKILNGEKTETRRYGVKRWGNGSVHQAKTNFSEGGGFAKIKIIKEPYQQELKTMQDTDAKAEGGFTIHESCKSKMIDKIYARMACRKCSHNGTCFQFVWLKMNGAWKPDNKPWVVTFETVKEDTDNVENV
ncbi:MAG TPA: hypothetical protein VN368_01545 [Candidatus Methylomirabilis sp.]|nr:hypothetical protein [Candidatus Methylomirabilis sp.]